MKEKLLKIENILAKVPSKLKGLYQYFIENLLTIAEKSKDLIKTNYELGLYHLNNGNIHDAKFRFFWLVKFKPDHALARYNLARCYIFEAKLDKAKVQLEEAIAIDPKLETAKYRLGLLTHSLKEPKIITEIVKEDYDSSAKRYEKYNFEKMGYKAPVDLVKAIKGYLNEDSEILDIGCGTGVIGMCLKDNKFKYLTGIDISENMLELAKEIEGNKIYTETKILDFNDLSSLNTKFNVITACMSFGYTNDLAQVLKSLSAISHKDAILAFIVLKSVDRRIDFDYEHGAICYSKDFLESIFSNWKILENKEINIYELNGPGLLYILRNSN